MCHGDFLIKKIRQLTLFVRDYDEAVEFYTEKLGFVKVVDTKVAPGIRLVAVAPNKDSETIIMFEKPAGKREKEMVGKQFTNMLVQLETDNIDETYERMKEKGVTFVEKITNAPWGNRQFFKTYMETYSTYWNKNGKLFTFH